MVCIIKKKTAIEYKRIDFSLGGIGHFSISLLIRKHHIIVAMSLLYIFLVFRIKNKNSKKIDEVNKVTSFETSIENKFLAKNPYM